MGCRIHSAAFPMLFPVPALPIIFPDRATSDTSHVGKIRVGLNFQVIVYHHMKNLRRKRMYLLHWGLVARDIKDSEGRPSLPRWRSFARAPQDGAPHSLAMGAADRWHAPVAGTSCRVVHVGVTLHATTYKKVEIDTIERLQQCHSKKHSKIGKVSLQWHLRSRKTRLRRACSQSGG